MSFLHTYVTGNPMLVETRRLYRKFFTLGLGKTDYARTGLTALVGIYILALFLLIMSDFQDTPDIAVILIPEAVVLTILPIVAFNSTIAGERERRSWDFLRVAPVTQGQIVAGKFLAAASVIGIIWLATLPFLAVLVEKPAVPFTSRFLGSPVYAYQPYQRPTPDLSEAVLASLVPLTASLLVLAITMFFSARCKNPLIALSITLGAVFSWTVGLPMLITQTGGYGSEQLAGLVTFNPVMGVAAFTTANRDTFVLPAALEAFILISLYVAMTITLLVWVEKTLAFADESVRFVPERKKKRVEPA